MANWYEPTDAQLSGWAAWVASRPEAVRRVAERFYPWKLYRLKSSGHRVYPVSISEHSRLDSLGNRIYDPPTLSVAVIGRFNLVAFERKVFGVAPDDLEECELPAPGEPLGSAEMPIEKVRELMKGANN